VRVPAGGSGRISMAGLVATRPGHASRLIYRTRLHRGRKGEKKGFAEADYAALLDGAHQQLGGPLVVVWDNLNTHVSTAMNTLALVASVLALRGPRRPREHLPHTEVR
jgi:hypothetical protein